MKDTGLRTRVIHNIAIISGFDEEVINETKRLMEDLLMSEVARGELAPGFQRIARETNPKASISKASCKGLKTVKSAITLVQGKARLSSDSKNA